MHLKEFEQATYWYTRALELSPEDRRASYAMAFMHSEQGNFDQALEIMFEETRADSSNYLPYRMLGLLYQQNGMYEKAIIEYKKYMKLRTFTPPFPHDLVSVYVEQGRLQEAIDLYNKTIEQYGEDAHCRAELSFLLSRIGKNKEARESALKLPFKYLGEVEVRLLSFYLGEIKASALEDSLKYTFIRIGDKKEVNQTLNYLLGMAYLHNLGQGLVESQRDTTKAIDYLQKHLSRALMDSYRLGFSRSQLKELNAYKEKN